MADNRENRAFDWDDTIENDSTFTLLPEGVYPFTVTAFERGRYGGGAKLPPCNKAVLTIAIDGGALGTATITHNLFLHARCEGLLCAFFTAIGLRKHGEPLKMPWERVPGARGMCEVGIREWVSDRTGETMHSNEIKRFLDPSAAPSPSAGRSYAAAQPVCSPLVAPGGAPSLSAAPSQAAPQPAPDTPAAPAAPSWTPGNF